MTHSAPKNSTHYVRNKDRKSLSIKAYGDLSDAFWLKNDFSNKVVVDEKRNKYE